MKPKINSVAVSDFLFRLIYSTLKKSFIPSNLNKNESYKKSQIVYHYTSIESFKKIIETESLIATNASYLNDKKEFIHAKSAFDFSLGSINDLKSTSKLEKQIIKHLIKDDQINLSNYYVTCFSAERDFLSQWMSYGDRGNGIAIGFDQAILGGCFQNKKHGAWVEYDSHKTLSIVNRINKSFLTSYSKFVSEFLFESEEEIVNLAVEIHKKYIVSSYLSHFKNSAFKNEKEFRIAIDENSSKVFDVDFMIKNKSVIVPYIKLILKNRFIKDNQDDFLDCSELPMNPISRLPISELVLGPCVDTDFVKPGLLSFLKKYGYSDIKIVSSQIPLREL